MQCPGLRGHILTENMSASGFSTSPHRKNHPAVLCGIQDSGGLAAIFAEHEHAELLYLGHSAGKSLGKTNLVALYSSIAAEWDQQTAEYICKT
jgi:hypothetical protein